MRLFYMINWHFLMRRKTQSLLCILGIAIGVAVVVSVDAANVSALRSFQEGVDVVAGKSTHSIVSNAGPDFDEKVVAPLVTAGYKASPVIEQFILVASENGETLRVLGVDPFLERPFRSYIAPDNSSPGTSLKGSFTDFLTLPDRIIVSAQFAERSGLSAGNSLDLLVGTERKKVIIHDTFDDENLRSGSENLAIMDIASAQEMFSKVGRVDRIDVIAAAEDVSHIQKLLPPGISLERSQTRTQRIEQMVRSFQMNLFALSLLAVFVGTFLIYNTLTFSVIQRRRHIGILRCLGLTRRQVGALFVAEAILLGVIGSVLGLAGGLLLAGYTVAAITGTITTLYTTLALPELHLATTTIAKAFLLGVGGSLSAALVPAYEAINVAPGAAVARSPVDTKMRARAPCFAVAGIFTLLFATVLGIVQTKSAVPGYLSAFAVVTGFGLLSPLVTVWGVRLISFFVKNRIVALLGIRNIAGSLSRTAPAIAALMVSLAMVIGVNLMVRSFRDSVIQWIDQTLRADVYIQPAGRSAQRDNAFLPDRIITALEKHPAVQEVDLLRHQTILAGKVTANLAAVRFAVLSKHSDYHFVEGSKSDAYARTANAGAVIISETLNARLKLRAGDNIPINTPDGPVPFSVAGVYRDYSTDGGTVLMDRSTYQRFWKDSSTNNAALYLAQDADPERVIAELRRTTGAGTQLLMRSNKSLRGEVLRIFDNTFAITYVLQFLAVIVAICGIVSALLALLLERTRELATLRSIGMTARQLLSMLYMESASIGLIASAMGIIAGISLSIVLVYVINVRSFGWTIQFSVYPGVLVSSSILAILAALAAAIYPAKRLKNLNLAAALREE